MSTSLEGGEICRNCGTALLGAYCHVCGQAIHEHNRSIFRLALEGLEGLADLDGRLAKTLLPLFFDPGRLARDYLDGRRVRHVPPFRLFFISLLIFMFVVEMAVQTTGRHGVSQPGVRIATQAATSTSAQAMATTQNGFAAKHPIVTNKTVKHPAKPTAFETWLTTRIGVAASEPQYYFSVLFSWGHRFAILLLPVLAIALELAYLRQRRFYVYDHLIVAMQFLSFEFLIFAVAWIVPSAAQEWAMTAAILWSPVNLYMTLRGAYGSGVPGAIVKSAFLWVSTLVFSGALVAGLLLFALREIGG
jgi:Protein of unknown function (DUF3667)